MSFEGTKYDEVGMPRFAKDLYPLGSYKNQKGPGVPINPEVANTLNLYAKKIFKDMQFLALIAGGDGGVRMGKSTVAQGWGYYYTEKINEGLIKRGERPIKFNSKNIAMSFEDLKEKAFKIPRYSCLILDESDDLTEHAVSKKMREINSFLQKNGQLNLFIILILDDYFKFPSSIAVTRSNFLAVVKFTHDDKRGLYYERGFYDLYDVHDKRILYYKGKKNFRDINCHKATLQNVYFHGGYFVDEKEYLAEKRKDLERFRDNKKEKEDDRSQKQIILTPIIENMLRKNMTPKEIQDLTLISKQTFYNWGFTKVPKYMSKESNILYNNTIKKNNCPKGLEPVEEEDE